MNRGMLKTRACGLLLFLFLSLSATAQEREIPSYISAQHKAVLQRWLVREPKLVVASDKDCGQCENEIANQKRLSGADYHPYYTVGDFNGDGKKDFAVALIELEADDEGRANQKFVVVIFNAPFKSRRPEPAFEKEGLNLRDGGLFFGPPRTPPYRLFIGLFGTDQGLTVIPKGRKYIGQ